MLTMREDILEAGHMSLFVRAPSKALWLYMGEYKVTAHPRPLSCDEFQALPRITREAWAKAILRHQSWASRTRIWLRKQGRAVTPSAVSEALSAHRKSKKEGADLGLKPEDVLRSFDAGDEVRTGFHSVVACTVF
ncbi:hypothetical protein BJV78DRAFT_167799 [Lactifluus subvellereus]|nr:hypothetical protein BJV78DRAFT_167799 [Lactifluus subvellereus]